MRNVLHGPTRQYLGIDQAGTLDVPLQIGICLKPLILVEPCLNQVFFLQGTKALANRGNVARSWHKRTLNVQYHNNSHYRSSGEIPSRAKCFWTPFSASLFSSGYFLFHLLLARRLQHSSTFHTTLEDSLSRWGTLTTSCSMSSVGWMLDWDMGILADEIK